MTCDKHQAYELTCHECATAAQAAVAMVQNLSRQEPEEICANCKFFDGEPARVTVKEASHHRNYQADGCCRINPPVVRDQHGPMWPGVLEHDYCGSFKLKVIP